MSEIISENKYAQVLREQGKYVITVQGIEWYDLSGFMLPAYLPHCYPEITLDMAREVLVVSKRPFVRWHTKFGKLKDGAWWWVVKRRPWSIDDIKDGSKRTKIRKGKKNFVVRPLTEDEIVERCLKVTKLAAARYTTVAQLETRETFTNSVAAARIVPGVLEYIGCFHGDVLTSFAENYIQANGVFCNIIRHDPAFLKLNSGYALIDGMLDYYLNEKGCDYFTNGSRAMHHETEFQEHIIKVFGYYKEYASIKVMYSPKLGAAVRVMYPFRGIIRSLNAKWHTAILGKANAILALEATRRACLDQ